MLGFMDFSATQGSECTSISTKQPLTQEQNHRERNALLRFDNGHVVTFADGTHNTFIAGTTGSGKTHSVLLPAFDRLIRSGFGGVVIDSKGSLAPYVRTIAKEAGRENDIVEAGPYDTAVRFDILAGQTLSEQEGILKALLLSYCSPYDPNQFFHMTGLHQFVEVCEVARLLSRRVGVPFGMHIPARALSDPQYAVQLFKRFKHCRTFSDVKEDLRLVRSIECTMAHILPSSQSVMEKRVWQEQTTYYAAPIRTGLGMLNAAPGIAANFLASGGACFEPEKLVYDERKIILLRLSPDSGEAGAGICRLLLRRFYAAAYKRGKSQPEGQYAFLVADEAQDYISTNPTDPLNDASWLAKCREFRVITLLCTQSVTALAHRAARGLEDVRSMLNNCNCRVFLYNDDQETCRLASIADETPLHELKSGECVLAAYDTQNRRHISCLTSLDMQYKAIQPVLEKAVQSIDVPLEETEEERLEQARIQDELLYSSYAEREEVKFAS